MTNKLDFYLNWLSAELKFDLIKKNTIDLSGINKPHAGPRDTFTLADEILENLMGYWHSADKQEIDHEDATPVSNVLDKLANLSRVVLLGEPGGGKTTTLQRLALRYAEQYRNASSTKPRHIPVFVKLAEFNGATSFEQHALKSLDELVPYLDQLPIVWLLDSFNEMPRTSTDGRALADEVIAFLRKLPGYGAGKFVISCRVADYKDELHELPDLDKIELRELSPVQIKAIIDRKLKPESAALLWRDLRGSGDLLDAWAYFDGYETEFWQDTDETPDEVTQRYIIATYSSLELYKGHMPAHYYLWLMPHPYGTHQEARQAIYADSRRLILLCRNPFMLNLVCTSVSEGGIAALRKTRAGLFGEFVELLLAREMRLAKQRGQTWLPDTAKRVKTALEHLAQELHYTEQRMVISKADALSAINQADGNALLQIAESANLIQGGETIRFVHQLLQEYFATAELHQALERGEGPARFFSAKWWEAGAYRETFVLLGETQRDPNGVARWLAAISPEVALNVILENGEGLTLADVTSETRATLIASANAHATEPDPRGRAAAYRVLARLNADQRAGVSLRADGVPDILWCDGPAGDFILGDDQNKYNPIHTVTLPAFRVAKYPITVKQFQAFMDDPQGFTNIKWWDSSLKNRLNQPPRLPTEQTFQYANHPCVDVSQYDAIAFCEWLSDKLGYKVRLPTEEEWEASARGRDKREYSYLGAFDPTKGNTAETGIDRTSAVGIFPDGASPYGVLDMTGNVREWTSTDYWAKKSEPLGSYARRTLRGGSWLDNATFARASYRFDYLPDIRVTYVGFRIVCSVPE